MKRVVKASVAKENAYKKATSILNNMKTLFDQLESMSMDYPSFVDDNDLADLYDCLEEDIPALQMAINGQTLEY